MPDPLPPRSVGDRRRSDRDTPPSDTRLSPASDVVFALGGTAADGPRALTKPDRLTPPRSVVEELADKPPEPKSLKNSPLPPMPPEPATRLSGVSLSG